MMQPSPVNLKSKARAITRWGQPAAALGINVRAFLPHALYGIALELLKPSRRAHCKVKGRNDESAI